MTDCLLFSGSCTQASNWLAGFFFSQKKKENEEKEQQEDPLQEKLVEGKESREKVVILR